MQPPNAERPMRKEYAKYLASKAWQEKRYINTDTDALGRAKAGANPLSRTVSHSLETPDQRTPFD